MRGDEDNREYQCLRASAARSFATYGPADLRAETAIDSFCNMWVKKFAIAMMISLGLFSYAWWAFRYGVAFSLRGVPPERHAFVLDVTAVEEKWWLTGTVAAVLSIAALVVAVGIYFREGRGAK